MQSREGWRPLRRPEVDPRREIDDELRLHLDGRVQEYLAQGLDETEARMRAAARFGDFDAISLACRNTLRKHSTTSGMFERGAVFMDQVVRDVRHAVRLLGRRPAFTATVLLTLTLAVGASTAVFSVVNGVLLRPLPHPEPDELVLVWEVDRRPGVYEDHNTVTVANYVDWRDQNRVFESIAAYGLWLLTYRGEGDPEQVLGGIVTPEFFRTLGVRPVMGRVFLEEEGVPGNNAVALLGHEFWTARFGGDSSIVGATINLASNALTVVGILPEDFQFLDRQPAVWVPRAFSDQNLQNRRSHMLNVVARMSPGVSFDAAQRDMDRVVDALRNQYPEFLTGWGVNVEPLTDALVGAVRPALVVLVGAVGFVLLIACVNIANLMLARTLAEHREDAIRTALGAGRRRLVQQRLTESGVLSLVGGGLGVVFAGVATRVLVAVAPGTLPRTDQISLDGRVMGFAIAVSVLTGLVFGLIPALQASRSDVASYIKEGSRSVTGGRGHRRLRAGFAVAQVAFSLVLLISAGLMVTTFLRLMQVDPGFAPNGVLSMKLSLTGNAYRTRDDQSARYDALLAAINAAPGVESVGLTKALPFEDTEWTWSVQIEGQPVPREGEKLDYGQHAINPDYLRTMGISLRRGRPFNEFDRPDGPLVALVNEAFVGRFFTPGDDPVGRRFALESRPDELMEIVGIVDDVHHYSLDTDPLPAFYRPYGQIPFNWFLNEMNLVVRSAGDPVDLTSSIRQIVRAADPNILVADVTTMSERVSASLARRRFALILPGSFAAVALAIAAVGIYGVIAYSVGQRSQEIGVRMALGARPGSIVGRFVVDSLRLITAGVGFGLVGAVIFTRFQTSLLFGVAAVDAGTYAMISLLLCIVALAATYLPARRATRVDPIAVLRDE